MSLEYLNATWYGGARLSSFSLFIKLLLMTITIRSLAFFALVLGGLLAMGAPALVSAQMVPCGWYYNGSSSSSCGTGTLLVYVQSLNGTGSSYYYGNYGNGNYGNGNSYSSSNFTVQVSGQNASPSSFVGSQSGTLVSITGGSSYSVTVPQAFGYTPSYSVGCNGTIAANQQATCVVTMSAGSTYSSYPQPYPYPYTYSTLSCNPSYQTVSAGQVATFTATGGNSGVYNWMTADRSYQGIGPVLNTSLESSGTQTVTVSDGYQTATCTVMVVVNGVITYPGSQTYIPPAAQYAYSGSQAYGSSAVSAVQYTYVPNVPNTGFAPISASSITFALVVLMGLCVFSFPYVRKAFAIVLR